MNIVAIIGTAGRDKSRPTSQLLWSRMYKAAKWQLECWFPENDYSLVSGGAALADHIAVGIHLVTHRPIQLFIPCLWDKEFHQYSDAGNSDWRMNPGKTANFYHREFSRVLTNGLAPNHSLETLHDKVFLPGYMKVGNGFHGRNRMIADICTHMIAFTWGLNGPCDGGTKHTWDLAQSKIRVHISLQSLATSP